MKKYQLNKCNAYIEEYNSDEFIGKIKELHYYKDYMDAIVYAQIKPTMKQLSKVKQQRYNNDVTFNSYMDDYMDMILGLAGEWSYLYIVPQKINKVYVLYSYETLVAIYFDNLDKCFLFPAWKFSTTTRQHISKFLNKFNKNYSTYDFLKKKDIQFALNYSICIE